MIIAGHHHGLYDMDDWQKELETDVPEEIDKSVPLSLYDMERPAFNIGKDDMNHLTRMLFSCLVDADYLDTERFMAADRYDMRNTKASMAQMKAMMEAYLQRFRECEDNHLNRLRREVQELCREAGEVPSRFFELTVPTGGGKTLASVLWAVSHAVHYDKKRVIIAIPFTSIVIQTAQTMRAIFGNENVLEHHSVVSEDDVTERNRLACENWDAPIVVTTNVQLFESMMSNKPGRCRKLHALCNSVVILDEVQSIPLTQMQPIVNSMNSYTKMFGTVFLFCTASQPILDGERKGQGIAKLHGLSPNAIHRIVGRNMMLHDRLRRARLDISCARVEVADVATSLKAERRVLCVVNTRRIAADIFKSLPQEGLTVHLSRMMCPLHIREVIERVKQALANDDGRVVRVVSTQLIEAGVDIDFPVVWRQMAGLDSLLQAAGRCNREGRGEEYGVTHVFQLKNARVAGAMGAAVDAMTELLNTRPDRDWFAPETMNEYYRILYSKTSCFDKYDITGLSTNVKHIAYQEISEKFRLIDDAGVTVIVNYRDAGDYVHRLIHDGPSRALMRQLGQYSVTVSTDLFGKMQMAGMVEMPWEGVYYIPLAEQYDGLTGLKVNNEYLEQNYII
ncbi:MAG: CRISPR-associated helicase Cas3', partial [Muribaculaceae bacterium]|nr:CRISPR-associated helicase Cas3' [Muribaculaceae bacterium]